MQTYDQHLTRVINELTLLRDSNRRPAIDEPANDFERSVNEHYDLVRIQDTIKEATKPLNTDERKLRDGLADSLRTFFGPKLKEGVNNYDLSNGRKLKLEHKVERKVDEAAVVDARRAYEQAGQEEQLTTDFDSMLRVKHELDKRSFNKLVAGSKAATAFARCIVTKFAAPGIKVD